MKPTESRERPDDPEHDALAAGWAQLRNSSARNVQCEIESNAVLALVSARRKRRRAVRAAALAVTLGFFAWLPGLLTEFRSSITGRNDGRFSTLENGNLNNERVALSVRSASANSATDLQNEIDALRSQIAFQQLWESQQRLTQLRQEAVASDIRRLRREAAIAHVLASAEP